MKRCNTFLVIFILLGGINMSNEEKVVKLHERVPSLKDERKQQRKQRANRRLLFFLSFFFLLLLCIIYFQSPVSYVKNITVIGNQFVEEEEIIALSEINRRTSIWNLSKDDIAERVLAHDEISNVTIERKLPNTINIIVEEYERVGYLFHNERYYPILETGRYLDALQRQAVPSDAPILIGFVQGETLAELAAELRKMPSHLIERISEIFHQPTNSDPLAIGLYMTDGVEVHTSVKDFSNKMAPYPSIATEIAQNKNGILHMRMSPYFEQFTTEGEEDSEGEG